MESIEFGRMVSALMVVLLLIGGLALLAKRWLPQLQASGRLPTKRLQVLESMVLDPRNRLTLVRLDDRELLLGVGPNGPVLLERGVHEPEPPTLSVGKETVR